MSVEEQPARREPDDLRARSEELLEFPKVRELLAGSTHFFLARELASHARHSYEREEADRLQAETSEAGKSKIEDSSNS